jgi:hypothetical protein
MDFEQIYKEERGFDVGKIHEIGTVYYSDDYVKWLEEKLLIQRVSQCNELVCDCTPISTQVSHINGRYICCNCNKPLLSQTCG